MFKFLEEEKLPVYDIPPSDGFCTTYADEKGKLDSLFHIHLNNKKRSLIVHELVHLTRMVFLERGIQYNVQNDEVMAYYIEFWFEQIEEILWKRGKRKKKKTPKTLVATNKKEVAITGPTPEMSKQTNS